LPERGADQLAESAFAEDVRFMSEYLPQIMSLLVRL